MLRLRGATLPHATRFARAYALFVVLFDPGAVAQAATPSVATEPTWVFFTDKGQLEDLRGAVVARQRELPAKTLARRAKVRPFYNLVDTRDLAVSERYVQRVRALASAPLRVRSRWLNAVSIELTAAQRDAILALPFVEAVQSVGRTRRRTATDDLRGPWKTPARVRGPQRKLDYGKSKEQLERVGIPAAHDCGLTGEGVTIGVLDTGFRKDLRLFKKLDIVDEYDFVEQDDNVSDIPDDEDAQDDHGTSCLGLIAGDWPGEYIGAAPRVKVLLAKTEDSASETPIEEDYYVAGLEWVEERGADIATSSLGYSDWVDPDELDGKTVKVSIATNIASENGMICLTSAGNSGPEPMTITAPADGLSVISVGSTAIDGEIAESSSRGPTADGRMKPEIVAPGRQVWVATTTDEFETGSGTSYAAPIVAGGVALLLQMNPKLTPQSMRDLIRDTAKPRGEPNNDFGWGELDIEKATKEFCECEDRDEDGFRDEACGGRDCDDRNSAVHPDATEVCDDGIDNDCDEHVDLDDEDCKDEQTPPSDSGSPEPSPPEDDPPSPESPDPESPKDESSKKDSESGSEDTGESQDDASGSPGKDKKKGSFPIPSCSSSSKASGAFALWLLPVAIWRRRRQR